MINKVSIHNFKSLRDVKVDLERFTVFVGPNASGKSSILQGLNLLCWSFQLQAHLLEQALGGELSQAASRGSNDAVELAAEIEAMSYCYRGRAQLTAGQKGAPGSPGPMQGRGYAQDINSADWRPWPSKSPKEVNKIPLPNSVLLRLEASKLVLPTPNPSDPTLMAPDGTGLHSALASMALNDPDSWQELQESLRKIIPSIRRLRHTKTAPNQPTALLFDTIGADSLPANQVSEGTLLVLGLLAALHSSSRPGLVLLDDLDRGLHPRAQKDLILLLRGLLETNPDLQILATTHSPYMLDCMETNEVRMTFLRDDEATVCAPLTSHPKFEKWKDEMTPGEMWSLFGEKWMVEQEATA